ncbi:endonuclease domain-containing protein [Streptomyces sp. NPDC050738]|uniref:endonuclease domain-containing protein n=1 Tax=Streptomyces sp. NPDC050738 TaxID=3154744 RepID=UPI00341A5535
MASLDDFPEARREGLLWHFAEQLDYYDIDHIVHISAGGTCGGGPYWGESCPRWEELQGPRFFDPSHDVGAIRQQLAFRWGDMCFTCLTAIPTALDHDHISGLVRGLLCGDCNTRIEECFHVAGCPFADYLNAPPAAPLGLLHPRHGERIRRQRAKAKRLGFHPHKAYRDAPT